MKLAVSDEQIDQQLNLAAESLDTGSRWPGMSFEVGVQAALMWATGQTDEVPIEDE